MSVNMKMKLLVQIEERQLMMEVEENLLTDAQDFFTRLDADMNHGWQWEREYTENLNALQRCQLIANRMLALLESDRHDSATLMAAYILQKLPGVTQVDINTSGEISLTEFSRDPLPDSQPSTNKPTTSDSASTDAESNQNPQGKLTAAQASTKARKEVSLVYEVSGGFQFKMLDPEFGDWLESEIFTDRDAAEEVRMDNFQFRFQQLMGQA